MKELPVPNALTDSDAPGVGMEHGGGGGGQLIARIFDCRHGCEFAPPTKACIDAVKTLKNDGGNLEAMIEDLEKRFGPKEDQLTSKGWLPEPADSKRMSRQQEAIIKAYRVGNALFVGADYISLGVASFTVGSQIKQIHDDEVNVYDKCNLSGNFNGPGSAV